MKAKMFLVLMLIAAGACLFILGIIPEIVSIFFADHAMKHSELFFLSLITIVCFVAAILIHFNIRKITSKTWVARQLRIIGPQLKH